MAKILPPSCISGSAPRTPTRNAFPCEIERCVPLFEGNVQRRLEEFRCLRSGIADVDVEVAELRLQLAKHLRDLFGLRHVGLHEETIGAAFADLLERLFRRSLVLEVVNADFDATLRQCQSNPSPDSARTAGDQRRFSIEGHRTLLWLEVSEAKVSRAMDSRKFRLGRRFRATKTSNCPSGRPTFRFVMRREMLRNFQTDLQPHARLLLVGCRRSLACQQGCETCARSRRARNA